MTSRRRLASAPIVAALAATGGVAFHRVFGWASLVPVVAVAAAVPTALAAAVSARTGRRRSPPLWVSVVLSLACWLLVVSETLFRAQTAGRFLPTPATISTAGGALRDSWKAMLTTILPAPASPRLLVLVHALVWLAAFAGTETALRTRTAAAPAIPAFAVLVVAVLLAVDGPGSNLALAAFVAGPQLPFVHSRRPFDPRAHVSVPPPQLREVVNPLDEVSGWLLSPGTPMFTVRATTPENWRLAVLDRFDGTTWAPSARFIPTGTRVPPGTGPAKSSRLAQTVTIQNLSGVWLPAADRPATVSGTGVDTDPGSGVLAAVTSLHPGMRYRVTSQVPQYTMSDLTHAAVADDPQARADLELPGEGNGSPAPELTDLRQLAQVATAGSISPIQEALRLASYLRSSNVYDVTAAPGHTYRNIDFFLFTTHHGTSEQFAASFAVLARLLGLPSRLAVGFRPGTSSGSGQWEVTSGDVLVWPEVDFQGIGWVPFYPTPAQAGAKAHGSTVPMGEPGGRQHIDQSISSSGRTPVSPPHHQPARTRSSAGRQGGGVPWLAIMAVALVALIAGYLLAVILVPYLRGRRRRRRATPAARIIGAWQQALAHLGQAGLPPTGPLTSHEVAEFGSSAVGGGTARHLLPLADMVNWVTFASFSPGTGVADTAADAAWEHSDAVGRLVVRATGRGQRLRRRLDPRWLRPARR
jgi:transglutaminase-like putative cysteine protease